MGNPPTSSTGFKQTMANLLWGRMVEFGWPTRIISLVFVVATVASMTYCQLGFWPIGVIDEKPVYLMLLLGPLVMGALMFGPLMGALFGLFAGAVVYSHATFLPLDFYEVYFMSPFNTFGLLTVVGALAGALFNFVLRRVTGVGARGAAIVAIGVAVSFAASGLMAAGTVLMYGGLESFEFTARWLLNSPFGFVVQSLIDAAIIVVLCVVVDRVLLRMGRRGDDRTLSSVFRNWMLLISSIVFMTASGVIFSAATVQAQSGGAANMKGEVDYLTTLIESLDGDALNVILKGYDVPLDGYVVITDGEGIILATDDESRYPVGASFVDLVGYGAHDPEYVKEVAEAFFGGVIADPDGASKIQVCDENGVLTMDVAFLSVGAYEGGRENGYGSGYVCVMRGADMVFANRLGAMAASTLQAGLLIAAIGILAMVLLNRVVVRRIDETNESLGRITRGNLNERVGVRDSREFTSLSTGINTTVSALKDTISEVEHRNAQDLATAKAIQESALPREFPPFPDIDRFDIYASMKTAKEVGGDFYDFFLIDDGRNNKLGFVMADVSGKGIPAALFMMTAKTQIRNYMETGMSVNEAIDAANHQLCIGNDAGMFVTAWVGVLDYDTGVLTYVNCGHNPPLVLTEGAWVWVKDVSGMPLGLFDGIPYEPFTRQLEPGEMLYVYTDGVTEAMDAGEDLFGEGRLEETLARYYDMNPRSVSVGVRRAITDFTKDAEQSDDITMLCLKYGVPPERKAVMVLPADDKQLVHVCNFVHEELHRRGAPKSVYNPLDIAAEELFVNVCHYAYPDATPDNPGEVRISFEYEANPPALTVQIADDGIPYDPLAKPDAVTPDDIMEVPIGGLGILMAKRSVDEMTYERVGASNVLTIVKKW